MITVQVEINAPIGKVWEYFTQPKHITKWNQASPDWHCPAAENDVRIGGNFKSTMAAKDGSFSFDFGGIYTIVLENSILKYTLEDDRKVEVYFSEANGMTYLIQKFDPESENSEELQQGGWQAILNSFKNYTESPN